MNGAAATLRRGLVLAVDDEPEILVAIEDLLDGSYRFLATTAPEAALATLRRDPDVAVIVTDQRMPGMSGDALLAAGRPFTDAEAILLTGYADHAAMVEALNRGRIVAYVAKPWDDAALRSAIDGAYARWALGRELALERSLLHGLLDHFADPVSFKDVEGRFLRLNAEKAAALGVPAAAALGRAEAELVDPDRAAAIAAAEAEAWRNGAGEHQESGLRHGVAATFSVRRIALPESGALVTIERNVTAQRELEARLRQADKMQALGTLAGGIAHDFNNLLTAILGSLGLAARQLGDGDPRLGRLIANATAAAERGAALTQRLLTFGRRRELRLQAVDVNAVIAEMREMLATTLGGVTVTTRLAPDLWPARIDPDQLHLAILNLCINARDAMPAGGTVIVASRNETVPEGAAGPVAPGDYVAVEVIDGGEGIPPELQERVLEPFFTTKEVGKGTGLGLSMVYALAREVEGGLRLASTPGEGTTVTVLLPRSAAGAARPAIAPVATAGDAARILLVDDDAAVREVTAAQLAELGHRVIPAPAAEAALAALAGEPGIGLLVADFTMPGMNGLDLAAAARRQLPDLPVLLITGFADIAAVPAGIDVLAKPFRQTDLAAAVARLLAGSRPPA